MMRKIDEKQAWEVARILSEECGLEFHHPRDADSLARSILVPAPAGELACREYRFCGALGFVGKFRNNGNQDNTPHVDCYREHETPARLAMIEAANKRLAELFADQQTPPEKS